MTEEFELDGLHCKHWTAENEIAVLQIIHGLGEMTDYYEQTAEYLTKHGISVYMSEHRAHGRTTRRADEGNVTENILTDIAEFSDYIKSVTASPIFILGHSLGATILQKYIKLYSRKITAAILVGCARFKDTAILYKKLEEEIAKRGEDVPCLEVFAEMFGGVAEKYKNEPCSVSWVTNDIERAKYYEKLPYTNVMYSNRFYKGFLGAIVETDKPDYFDDTENKVPVLILSGNEDIVGEYGKVPSEKAKQLLSGGFDVKLCMYENMRHSIMQEIEREKVYHDIAEFINNCI